MSATMEFRSISSPHSVGNNMRALTKAMTTVDIAAYQAKYGCRGLLNGSVFLSIPCALIPAWNRMYVTEIPNQVIRPQMDVMFENHPNTLLEPELIPMYESVVKRAQNMIET